MDEHPTLRWVKTDAHNWHARDERSGYGFSVRKFATKDYILFWCGERGNSSVNVSSLPSGKMQAEEILVGWENRRNHPFKETT